MAPLRRLYAILNFIIGTKSKGPDIQRLSLCLRHPGDQVLRVLSHQVKHYIYIYGEKLRFIALPIGAQYQQVNVTPDSVWSSTHSFQDRTINLLAWKIIFPTPPSSPRDDSIVRSSRSISGSPEKYHQDQA